MFEIPGFPYPRLLLDTSTVEGRALTFVANAIANNVSPLVTSDRRIRSEYQNAVW